MRPLVGHRLRLAHRRDLGGLLVALGALVEVDPVGEDLVVGLDVGIDLLVGAELALGPKDDGDQGELGLVDGNAALAERLGQSLVEVFEQPEAGIGEGLRRLIQHQVVPLPHGVKARERPGKQLLAHLVGRLGAKRFVGKGELVRPGAGNPS